MDLEHEDFSECPACEEGEQESEPHAHRRHSRRSPDVAACQWITRDRSRRRGAPRLLMGGEGNGGGDLRRLDVEEQAPRRPRTRRHVGFSPPWSIRLIRRYPAPILERTIFALGLAVVIGQSVLIAWMLS